MTSINDFGNSNDIDFGRSFVRFSTTRVNHTPRMGLAASCTLQVPGSEPVMYHLSVACIAENMYEAKGHIQEPVAEFNIILQPRVEFMFLRKHADSVNDRRAAYTFGKTMVTNDGKGASVVELDAHLARFKHAMPIKDHAAFKDALLGNHPINGRTIYTDADGQTKVTLDYPVNTGNVRNDREEWQVDAGPILAPALTAKAGKLTIERLEMAFIVYNTRDYSELAVRDLSPVGSDGHSAFYKNILPIQCRNEMYVCKD